MSRLAIAICIVFIVATSSAYYVKRDEGLRRRVRNVEPFQEEISRLDNDDESNEEEISRLDNDDESYEEESRLDNDEDPATTICNSAKACHRNAKGHFIVKQCADLKDSLSATACFICRKLLNFCTIPKGSVSF